MRSKDIFNQVRSIPTKPPTNQVEYGFARGMVHAYKEIAGTSDEVTRAEQMLDALRPHLVPQGW